MSGWASPSHCTEATVDVVNVETGDLHRLKQRRALDSDGKEASCRSRRDPSAKSAAISLSITLGSLMRSFGVSEFVGRVLAEVCPQEASRLRQDQMEVVQRLKLQLQLLGFQIQNVAAVLVIARQEVQVVSRHAERARKPGRPQSNERPRDILETELALSLRRIEQAGSRRRRINRPRSDACKSPVEAKRVEKVSGFSMRVAQSLQL